MTLESLTEETLVMEEQKSVNDRPVKDHGLHQYRIDEHGNVTVTTENGETFQCPIILAASPLFSPRHIFTSCHDYHDGEKNLALTRDFNPPGFDLTNRVSCVPGHIPPDKISGDTKLYERLFDCFAIRDKENNQMSDMWSEHTIDKNRTLDLTVRARDVRMTHHLFSCIHSSTLSHGMQQGFQAEWWLRNIPGMLETHCQQIHDRLISLCEYMGILKCQNPEQGGHPFDLKLEDLFHSIFVRLDVLGYKNVQWPTKQGGLIGLLINSYIIDERQLYSLYYALKIANKLKNNKGAKICDLGGGNGLIIYFLYMMGFTNLYICDLPEVSLIQAFMLIQHFGHDAVRMTGETHSSPINVIGPAEFLENDYDLVVNTDSLPEMSKENVMFYFSHIQDHAKIFYSVNQESEQKDQLLIWWLIEQEFKNFKLQDRSLFWMRKGYVEEWYEIEPNSN